jgi:hypothetical protein
MRKVIKQIFVFVTRQEKCREYNLFVSLVGQVVG